MRRGNAVLPWPAIPLALYLGLLHLEIEPAAS